MRPETGSSVTPSTSPSFLSAAFLTSMPSSCSGLSALGAIAESSMTFARLIASAHISILPAL